MRLQQHNNGIWTAAQQATDGRLVIREGETRREAWQNCAEALACRQAQGASLIYFPSLEVHDGHGDVA